MATALNRVAIYLKTISILLWCVVCNGVDYGCGYGEPCPNYDPSPPGRTPPCAQPTLTYCLHPEPYPEAIIRNLFVAGRYDIRTLLSDESNDDFGARHDFGYPYKYGPNSHTNIDQISLTQDPLSYLKHDVNLYKSYNKGLFSQKTPLQPPTAADPSPYNIHTFRASNYSKFTNIPDYQSSLDSYWDTINRNPTHQALSFDETYRKKIARHNHINYPGPNLGIYNQNQFPTTFNPNYDPSNWLRPAPQSVTQYNPAEWWKYASPSARSDVSVDRSLSLDLPPSLIHLNHTAGYQRRRYRRNAELVKAAAQRTLTGAEALRIALGLASSEALVDRPRRQAPNTQQLCSSRTQFITPRAALNNKGSWKYVVNMPDNMTQLVRAEICTSSTCSNLCSLPFGYSSRCEQKYVQKRLVALQTDGRNLYTDIFWIPSCCQCTIVANN